ncbi:MAG: endonuclease/exonuclease/phosphatase family protein [Betaproteobacteria bacterium]|nr:endonuclease/exonuclease/phosphatase family protein [Betaproteobacteria bacterium]
MKLITWNIQWARGIDLAVDLARIARTAREFADFDLLCLQEVAVNYPGLPGSRGEDQVAELSRALPGFSAHYGVATDVDDGKGGRSLFGNLVFSRLSVIQIFRHLLPWPADPAVKSMQRSAIEVVVQAPRGPVRVTTTHLEYYSSIQCMAQVSALRALHQEACSHASAPRVRDDAGQPFQTLPRPPSAILTGDFNFRPEGPEYRRITAPFDAGTAPALIDAWTLAHPGIPHAPSAGVHEDSWAKPPFCCDFIFVTADLAERVRDVAINAQTQASDHQPVLIEIAD